MKDQIKNSTLKLRELPIRVIIPNMVTFLAMACGISAIQYAANSEWQRSIIMIVLASVFDGLDGRVARMLKGTSNFGAELDSLSDFVSFGVAPGFLMYRWSASPDVMEKEIGWVLALLFACSCAFRLARFNTMLDRETPPHWKNYFTGLPAPGGAAVAIIPILFYFNSNTSIFASAWVVKAFLLLSALLMVSRIPTVSFKKIKIPVAAIPPLFVILIVAIGCLFVRPWLTLGVVFSIYLCSVPFSVICFIRTRKKLSSGENVDIQV